jgi:hypothetical protein
MVLVRDNPLTDISAMRKPIWGMLAGQFVVSRVGAVAD